MTTKTCPCCHRSLPPDEFAPDGKGGFRRTCRRCLASQAVYDAKYRARKKSMECTAPVEHPPGHFGRLYERAAAGVEILLVVGSHNMARFAVEDDSPPPTPPPLDCLTRARRQADAWVNGTWEEA